ncbi:spermidine resistance protein [Tilletia horrida]|nr:spermidine resistance protein [Tilletia horrida]
MVAASITPMPHSPPPSATATATATAAAPTNGPPADPSGPFEGPEKLLELWFKPASPTHSLRSVQRDTWQAILNTVSCTILSVLTHHHQQGAGEAAAAAADSPPCDAYLLSESSMFVFDHKLILKTCGTTTLLLGLEHILHLAHHVLSGASSPQPSCWQAQAGHTAPDARLGAQLVERVFYSRKSFMFPDRQKGPHKDWMLEVALLDDFFTDGAAYTVGKMNGDHWLLYMASQSSAQDAGASSSSSSSSTTPRAALSAAPAPTSLTSLPYNDNEDQTLEILMTHLDPAATRAFYFPPLLSQKKEEQQEEGEEEDKAPPGVAPLPTSADSSSGAGRQFQQATTKGGAASIDEPVDDDEEADPGPGSASAGGAKMANGTVGCAPGSGDEDEGSALEEEAEEEEAEAAASGQDEDDRGHVLGAQTSAAIGLASLFSSASASSSSEQHQLDAFAFEPCGYSANALIAPSSSSCSSSAASEDGEEAGVKHTAGYWTVHVTPEPECSYASFETNVRFLPGSTPASSPSGQEKREKQRQQPHDLASLIRRVVDIFQPGKMSITLFLSSTSEEDKEEAQAQAQAQAQVVVVPAAAKAKADGKKEAETNAMALDALVLRGYRRTDRILYEFEGYDLTFVTFERVGLRGAGVGAGAAAVKAVKAA